MKKNRIRYIVSSLMVLVMIVGFVLYKKVINPEHREIAAETTEFTLPVEDLQFHFLNNQGAANEQFIDKVVETYGTVTEIGANLVVLEDMVQANFLKESSQKIIVGDVIKIKGRCIGFDEFLLLVKMDQTTTIKIN